MNRDIWESKKNEKILRGKWRHERKTQRIKMCVFQHSRPPAGDRIFSTCYIFWLFKIKLGFFWGKL